MTIPEIETKMIIRVREHVEGVLIESTPSDPDEYSSKGAEGCILVRYLVGDYSRPPVPNGRQQPREMKFAVFVGSPYLHQVGTNLGVYEYLRLTRLALTSFPVGSRHNPMYLYPITERDFGYKNGILWYVLVMGAMDNQPT